MPDNLDANSIRQRITSDEQERVDKIMRDYFARESELGAYDAEVVKELGRNAI